MLRLSASSEMGKSYGGKEVIFSNTPVLSFEAVAYNRVLRWTLFVYLMVKTQEAFKESCLLER